MEFEQTLNYPGYYRSRFVRVGERICVTTPNDMETPHDTLAEQDGVIDLVFDLKTNDPTQADAGFLDLNNRTRHIEASSVSTSLALPRPKFAQAARAITVQTLGKLAPGYSISARL